MKFDALKNRSYQAKARRWSLDKKSTGQSSRHTLCGIRGESALWEKRGRLDIGF
jgi:hypothetical protein